MGDGSAELQVVENSEFGRVLVSNVGESGERVEEMLGEASLDEALDFALEFASDVLMRLRPCDLRNENGESLEEKELRVVERELRFCCLSFSRLLFSFLALCSPMSSRSGSAQMTSNMMKVDPQVKKKGMCCRQDAEYRVL